ncbi:hypothetical protein J3E68DRAFT_368067 [Trichoderma sp. SZMC 28012]
MLRSAPLSLWGILSGVSGGVFGRRLVAGSSTNRPREKAPGPPPFQKSRLTVAGNPKLMVALASSTCPQQTACNLLLQKRCLCRVNSNHVSFAFPAWEQMEGPFNLNSVHETCHGALPFNAFASSSPLCHPPFRSRRSSPAQPLELPQSSRALKFIFSWGIDCVVLGSHPFPCYHHSPSQLYTPLPTSSSICFDALVMTCGLPHTTIPSS